MYSCIHCSSCSDPCSLCSSYVQYAVTNPCPPEPCTTGCVTDTKTDCVKMSSAITICGDDYTTTDTLTEVLVAMAACISDVTPATSWTALDLLNDYTQNASGPTAQYRVNGDGLVTIRAAVIAPAVAAAINTNAFRLPSGARPASKLLIPILAHTAAANPFTSNLAVAHQGLLTINTNGYCTLDRYDNTSHDLEDPLQASMYFTISDISFYNS